MSRRKALISADEPTPVEFRSCRIAASAGVEDGRICLVNDIIYAVLIRLLSSSPEEQGWYLQIGFGPCDQEGLLFTRLSEAESWIQNQINPRDRKPEMLRGSKA